VHYKCLWISHKAYYWAEPKAHYYDLYMERKDWERWGDSVPLDEVEKLFDFIIRWDYHFQGAPNEFQRIYGEISPIIKSLEHERLEDVDFTNDELVTKIEKVFDEVARCSWRYESTDSSKICHTILPNLFVMWDRRIRKGILGSSDRDCGAIYAREFLPKMQSELREALNTCMQERDLSEKEAKRYIRRLCDNKPLPKLIDEYNYMIFTRPLDFEEYIEKIKKRVEDSRENDEITNEQYEEFLNEISFLRKVCLSC